MLLTAYIMNYKLGFLFVAIFSTTLAEDKKRDETCKTPKDEDGKCVPLNQCQVIYNAISSRNKTILDFAKNSYCGSDEETLVCCENPSPVVSTNLEKDILLGNTACGLVKEEPRIWGGELTKIGEFPWIVGIDYKDKKTGEGRNMLCGGSLINDEWVLTGAHCLLSRDFEPVSVRLGEWDTSKDPDCEELVANTFCADPVKIITIKETIPHPLYSTRTAFNDIGLIHLEDKVHFTDFITPVCLSHSGLPPLEDNVHLTVTGWGLTENDTQSDILRKAKVPLVSKEICKSKFEQQRRKIGSHHICAGGEGKDSCQGDGGSPLMSTRTNKQNEQIAWYQDGITSFGARCGLTGWPSVYTKVADYANWIVHVIAEYKEV